LFLFRNGEQIGALDTIEGYYRPWDGREWGPKGKVDLAKIRAKGPDLEVIPHGKIEQAFPKDGVDTDKLDKDRYRCRDHERLTKIEALQMIQDVPSYHLRPSFTVIGTAQQTAKLKEDVKSGPLAQWLQETQCLVQFYEPGDWAVRPETGFVADGSPTIYWQDKRNERGHGKVLFHGTEYTDAPTLVAFLRRADPNRDPKKDPDGKVKPLPPADPNNPDSPVSSPLAPVMPYLIPGGLILALLTLLFRR